MPDSWQQGAKGHGDAQRRRTPTVTLEGVCLTCFWKAAIIDKHQLPPLQQASIFDVRAMSEAERARLGYLVLVMRRWPQGFSWEALNLQLWLPDAGPSPELLKAYQAKQIDWEEFSQHYRVEQLSHWRRAGYYKVGKGDKGRRESQLSPLQHLDELRRQYGLVTILCHERKGHCHRYVLEKLALEMDGSE